jgi:demethylmenaquinone methyltransferase/2-methoxy-6-polyprenyl-1,4-benzoquinol methylase
VLPGYPLLEARLNATCSGYLPFLEDKKPEQNFLRAMRGFRQAGLEGVRANTFVGNIQAPLRAGERAALASLFAMLWGEPGPGIAPPEAALPGDWEDYLRLCDPDSPHFILEIPEYYAFFTYTLIQGEVPTSK